MKIGVLTAAQPPACVAQAHGPFFAMFSELFKGQGFTFHDWNIEEMIFPSSVSDADGWLITGARHGAYEDHAFIPPLEDFIRASHAAHMPMIGICFGHQIIAQALGARVQKFEGGWALGRKSYSIDGIGRVHLTAWHQDQVVERPSGAQVIASNDFTQFAGLRYGDHCITLQPHPEITPLIRASYARWQLGENRFSPDLLNNVIADTTKPGDEARLGQFLAEFLKTAHSKRMAMR